MNQPGDETNNSSSDSRTKKYKRLVEKRRAVNRLVAQFEERLLKATVAQILAANSAFQSLEQDLKRLKKDLHYCRLRATKKRQSVQSLSAKLVEAQTGKEEQESRERTLLQQFNDAQTTMRQIRDEATAAGAQRLQKQLSPLPEDSTRDGASEV